MTFLVHTLITEGNALAEIETLQLFDLYGRAHTLAPDHLQSTYTTSPYGTHFGFQNDTSFGVMPTLLAKAKVTFDGGSNRAGDARCVIGPSNPSNVTLDQKANYLCINGMHVLRGQWACD
ncbi:hypothetical protein [Dyella sp. A6]|uniref:hypothetical protein n=1 Tax=Dyella aluminiiresistens TaxID=3069105 RepID=UPI002E78694D|nr:hypothetical protein [Dyella sp. A6]